MRLIEISLLKNIPLLPWIIERERGVVRGGVNGGVSLINGMGFEVEDDEEEV
jgi:hypothetical protein